MEDLFRNTENKHPNIYNFEFHIIVIVVIQYEFEIVQIIILKEYPTSVSVSV